MDERFLRMMRVGVVLAGAVPLALLAAVGWRTHDDAIRSAEASLDAVAQAAELHARRAMERNEVVVQHMLRLLKDDDDAAVRAREPELRALANAILVRLPHLSAISVRDAEGRFLVSTLPFPFPASEQSRTSEKPAGNGGVLIDPITGEAQLRIVRPRASIAGKPAGVVELTMTSSYFTEFYRQLTRGGSRASAAIVAQEGFVFASWPPELGLAALPKESALRRALQASPGAGTLAGHVFAADDDRHAAFRRVGEHPLFVVAAQDRAAVLAEWKRQMLVLGAIVVPITVALLLASWIAVQRTRREIEARRGLEREADQRRTAEEALRHAQRLDALGQLAGGLAHDFSNLLTVVANSAELIKQAVPSAGERPEFALMQRAVRSGSGLTRRLLAFSRRQAHSAEVLHLPQALHGMLELLQTTAGRGVSLELGVAPDTPTIKADRAELEMALINLVANARDALGHAGTVRISARRGAPEERPDAHAAGYAVISVADQGPGMSADVRERAFEPFFTTKPAGSGTGLGLSQVYGFCKQVGGGVEIDSQPAVGTTVTMFLPATMEAAATRRPRSLRAEHPLGRTLH